MKYEEIFPAIDEMFGADEGTAEKDVRHRLETGPFSNKHRVVLDTGGDCWEVARTGDTVSIVRDNGNGNARVFRAMVSASTMSVLDTEAAGKIGVSDNGRPDPEKIAAFMRKEIRFRVAR